MSKKSEQRAAKRAARIARQDELIERVRVDIEGGAKLPELQDHFAKSVLNPALGRFAQTKYSLLEQALGPSASTHKVLVDECLDIGILPHAHTHIGITRLSALEFGKSILDTELFPAATEHGYRAILSCDGIRNGNRHLCGIAKAAYDRGAKAPQIILIPQKLEDSIRALERYSTAIAAALNQPCPVDILDAQR